MWIKKEELLEKVKDHPDSERFLQIIEEVKVYEGPINVKSKWIKLERNDPRLDPVEIKMFSDETYMCEACGKKSYFGAKCQKNKYCTFCGAQMKSTGEETK
ncbi:MAG: hypothetical protein IJW67_13580 [Blautia sp.]|nr:hypothetical protein [Blautia sp.]